MIARCKTGRPRNYTSPVDVDAVVTLYAMHGSTVAVARLMGCSANCVTDTLRRAGASVNKRGGWWRKGKGLTR